MGSFKDKDPNPPHGLRWDEQPQGPREEQGDDILPHPSASYPRSLIGRPAQSNANFDIPVVEQSM